MNPLFNALGGGQMPGAIGDFQRMMQQFQQFKATFQGDVSGRPGTRGSQTDCIRKNLAKPA